MPWGGILLLSIRIPPRGTALNILARIHFFGIKNTRSIQQSVGLTGRPPHWKSLLSNPHPGGMPLFFQRVSCDAYMLLRVNDARSSLSNLEAVA